MTDPVRLSNMTEYRHGHHVAGNGAETWITAHTDVFFKWRGDRYACRFNGALSEFAIHEEEDRFIERRHEKRFINDSSR